MPSEKASTPAYVAFISYAREDEAFARRLESEIEAWPVPGSETSTRVFRDRSDFTGSAYEFALDEHLGNSAALIVLCSPHARRSSFVGDEIARFARLHGADRIFPILVDGLPDNEADDLKSFPQALLEAHRGRGIPLGAEFRHIDLQRERLSGGRFESEWYKLLGNLFDQPAAEIQAHDKRRLVRRQRRQMALSSAAVAFLLVVAAAIAWLWQRAVHAEQLASEMSARAQTELAELGRENSTGAAGPAAATSSAGGGGGSTTAANSAPVTGASPYPPPPPPGGVELPPSAAPGPSAQPAPSAQPTPSAQQTALKARIYFHIRDESQRATAQRLKAALDRAGIDVLVPGVQRLDVGPTQSSELRYFRPDERAEAERIADILTRAGATDLAVKKVAGYENSPTIRKRHFELWLKPGVG